MRDKKVIITSDRISYADNLDRIVMDVISKDLMCAYSNIVCQNGGSVLDVGFGLGYSAQYMSEYADFYTCIETNPQVYEFACEWAKTKNNVKIIFGDWYELIPKMNQKFDGIFMDTYDDPNYNEFEKLSELIANENCVLSIFNYHFLRSQSELNEYCFEIDNYKKYNKIYEKHHMINWTYFIDGKFQKSQIKGLIKKTSEKII